MIDPHTLKPIQEKPPELDSKMELPTFLNEIVGFFQTVSAVPTVPPRYIQDQIQIYTNGSTYRLYWYDSTNKTWHYASGT